MATEFNSTTMAAASHHEKNSAVDTSPKQPLITTTEKQKWWKHANRSPNLYDFKVVLSKLEAANIAPLPGGVGYSVQPLSATINPLNKDQVPGVGNYPARKAKRNANALTCCLVCANNSTCKTAKPSECAKATATKRKCAKRKRACAENTKQLTAENHLSDTQFSAFETTGNPVVFTSVLEWEQFSAGGSSCTVLPVQGGASVLRHSTYEAPECISEPQSHPLHRGDAGYRPSVPIPAQDVNHSVDSAAPATPTHSSNTAQQLASARVGEVAGSSVNATQVPASSVGCVEFVSQSSASCLSDTSLQQVSSFTDHTTGCPVNETNAPPSNTEEVPVASLRSCLPPLPLQEPQIANFPFYGHSTPSPFYQPLAGQQPGNLPIPWAYDVFSPRPPIYPLVQYGAIPFAANPGRVPTNVAVLSNLNSNPLTANSQGSVSLESQIQLVRGNVGAYGIGVVHQQDGVATSMAEHQKRQVNTVSRHPRSHVGLGIPVVSRQSEHWFGFGSTSVGHRENHVGLSTTRVEHQEGLATCSTSAGYQRSHNDTGGSSMGHRKDSVSSFGQSRDHVGASRTSLGQQKDNAGVASTRMGHQKGQVDTVSRHPRSHVSMDISVVSHKEDCFGFDSTSVGHQENHVSKDCVSNSHAGADNLADSSTSANDDGTFSISSLLPDLPNETTSSTFRGAANPRQPALSSRTTVGCFELERALSLVTKRSLEDYGWLLDRYCFDYQRDASSRGIIRGVKSFQKLISRTELALKTEKSQLQRSCLRLSQRIKLRREKLVNETKKYEHVLLRKQTAEMSTRVVEQKEAELEEILSKLKVLSAKKDEFQQKWLNSKGTVLGSKTKFSTKSRPMS